MTSHSDHPNGATVIGDVQRFCSFNHRALLSEYSCERRTGPKRVTSTHGDSSRDSEVFGQMCMIDKTLSWNALFFNDMDETQSTE